MDRRLIVIGLIVLTLLAATGCRGGEKTLPPHDALALSVQALEDSKAFLLRARVVTEYEGAASTSETEAGYEEGEEMFAHVVHSGEFLSGDDITETLYIPNDLYLRTRGGSWYVRSPWNVGIPSGEATDLGSKDPIAEYRELVSSVDELAADGTRKLENKSFLYFEGTLDLDDVPSGTSQHLQSWLHKKTYLPRKLQVDLTEQDTTVTVTIEFLDYNMPPALPQAPPSVRPWRDFELPEAPCTGESFRSCLAAQTGLEDIAHDFCSQGSSRICLVPLGAIDPAVVHDLVDYYQEQYALTVVVVRPSELPIGVVEPQREQVDASALTDHLTLLVPETFVDTPPPVVIGLTSVDLFDPDSTFRYVFGMKQTSASPLGVISTFRMNPETYGYSANYETLLTRTRKMLSKYIGLLYFGLPLSSDPTSPLYDSIGGPEDLDNMSEPLTLLTP